MEAVKDAEAISNLLNNSDLTDEERQDIDKVKAQLDHSKVYYEWLAQLSEALETGEIFKYFPIPEHEDSKRLKDINPLAFLICYKLSSCSSSFT